MNDQAPTKYRWRGRRAAGAARAELLRVLAVLLEKPGVFDGAADLKGVADVAVGLGLATRWAGGALVIGNPGALALTLGQGVVELEVVDHRDRARWLAHISASVLASARALHAHKPRLGRTHKLGARVSEHAAAKLRAHAERQGVSEACALDRLLLALP